MNKLAATVCAFLLVSSVAFAQVPPCAGGDSYAVVVDTLRTTLTLAPSCSTTSPTDAEGGAGTDVSGGSYRAKGKSNGQITLEICIWRTSNGYEYSVDPSSIVFSGDSTAIDGVPTRTLFDMIAQAAIGQGMANGYSVCKTTSCESNLIRVNLPSCVMRSGKGTSTRIETCESGSCCTRIYSLCCPEGSSTPTLQFVQSQGGGCTSGGSCESLCD